MLEKYTACKYTAWSIKFRGGEYAPGAPPPISDGAPSVLV